jgi:integrase
MSRPIKPSRLWLEPARRRPDGSVRPSVYVILDRGTKRSTRCGENDRAGAEAAFERYLAEKRVGELEQSDRGRDPAQVYVADAIGLYRREKIEPRIHGARLREFNARAERLLTGLGTLTLDQIDSGACARYARARRADSAARRELEDLRAAVNHYCKRKRIPCVAEIELPERGLARERWLTRAEAARLLWAAWRMKQSWKGRDSDRATGRHLARFILIGLYTGSRHTAICSAAFERTIGRGHIDLDHGIFYRAALGMRRTKKRQPPVRLPPRLLAHLRRWRRLGISKSAVIEWRGKPIKKINKSFRTARRLAGLGDDVVPHTLRHTCGTWIAISGTAKGRDAAEFLGVTEEVFDRVYGHHCPDHQAQAVASFSFKPLANGCEQNSKTKRDQKSNKIAVTR